MSTHTKEAISLRPSGLLATTNGNVRFIAHMERHAPIAPHIDEMDDQDQADGERLATCWNACLGIENPQEAISLLYRMARHMRGTDKMEPVEWGLRAIDLLNELREIDPATYELEVRITTATEEGQG